MPEKQLATSPANDNDFDYVWRVYKEAIRPVIEPRLKDGWSDDREIDRFRKIWKVADSHIITLDGTRVGWGAISQSKDVVRLEHLYIEAAYRQQGIGSRLVSELLAQWKKQNKTVYAPVLKNSPAINTLARLGFQSDDSETSPLVHLLVHKHN